MQSTLRAIASIAILTVFAPQGLAQGWANTDPDWPCHQIKAPTFSLAAVWAGPDLDLTSRNWRNEVDVAELTAKMTQRRVPIVEVQSAIADFKTRGGPDVDAKLLAAFAAAFQDLTGQRSQILEGLERFGRKQRAMADRIRLESEAVQKTADREDGQTQTAADSQERLQWDIRIFEDRHRTATFVCEAPALIEQRIGAIARAVQEAR